MAPTNAQQASKLGVTEAEYKAMDKATRKQRLDAWNAANPKTRTKKPTKPPVPKKGLLSKMMGKQRDICIGGLAICVQFDWSTEQCTQIANPPMHISQVAYMTNL